MSIQEAERGRGQRVASLLEPPPGNRILSFRQWCALNNISLATGRRIIASGNGPKVTQLSERRMGIREDHNRQWQESRLRGA